MAYKIKDGYFRNPLLNGNMRNMKCFCKSGKKIKKCCGLIEIVNKSDFDKLNTILKAVKNA